MKKPNVIVGAVALWLLVCGPCLLISLFIPMIGIPMFIILTLACVLAVCLKLSGRDSSGRKISTK